MLSYQHGYHAGNFADVIKHLTLSRIFDYQCKKDKPLFYLETHSGKGLYDLKDGQATKTLEFQQGISLLWEARHKLPKLFQPYLSAIQSLNAPNQLRFYPGSPYLAINLLRSIDRLICAELHPREFASLSSLPSQGKKVFFTHSDGLIEMQALLPPPERRGIVFIDPSFEIKQDYKRIPRLIKNAYSIFSTGVYCLWYPIIDNYLHQQLIRGMQEIDAENKIRIEFSLSSSIKNGMSGCGLWVINPPYVLAKEMEEILNTLKTLFNSGTSSYIIET